MVVTFAVCDGSCCRRYYECDDGPGSGMMESGDLMVADL